jgi:L-ascorbate metabolism protein UlaG (beta-lactamase superfamily)
MRITFIGHASLLIEANGLRILSGSLVERTVLRRAVVALSATVPQAIQNALVDYVYISHGHHDHFHPPSLKLFWREGPRGGARSSRSHP